MYDHYMNYCWLWLFSACAYKHRLQETMRLTDNVRLTTGIIVATPSMRKHVIAKRVIDWSWTLNKRQERRRWQAPRCRTTLFFFMKVWSEATIFSKGYGLQEQERLYKFDKKQETLMIEMLWLCSKPMEQWLDMCLALCCWVLLDSKAF